MPGPGGAVGAHPAQGACPGGGPELWSTPRPHPAGGACTVLASAPGTDPGSRGMPRAAAQPACCPVVLVLCCPDPGLPQGPEQPRRVLGGAQPPAVPLGCGQDAALAHGAPPGPWARCGAWGSLTPSLSVSTPREQNPRRGARRHLRYGPSGSPLSPGAPAPANEIRG